MNYLIKRKYFILEQAKIIFFWINIGNLHEEIPDFKTALLLFDFPHT